ncbi:hypothetical protein G7Y31_00965 [Corynebacterium lizhenjunii]|uniref:Uncharacterized protein n=1 Tax=Corynebacterium lizhenjunii TaxID=2709394 RepID=A0A7T0KFV1_9CORY|nr:hypothetical protein [Corynebacterium lizhenjunii]QPK79329.1 hypothetical protein G7Y31_00965 [Corynebacterium lizhenjunii]
MLAVTDGGCWLWRKLGYPGSVGTVIALVIIVPIALGVFVVVMEKLEENEL